MTFWTRLALSIALAAALIGCEGGNTSRTGTARVGGDKERGERTMVEKGCGACHRIPGIRSARGDLAAPLDRFARRSFISGDIPNTPENLVHWIEDPRRLHPKTAMPALGLEPAEARDVAAYLYSLD